jgi:hypothetical protein
LREGRRFGTVQEFGEGRCGSWHGNFDESIFGTRCSLDERLAWSRGEILSDLVHGPMSVDSTLKKRSQSKLSQVQRRFSRGTLTIAFKDTIYRDTK